MKARITAEELKELIPVGRNHPISRELLCALTGMSDRQVRDAIAKARRDTVILNMQDGAGYYRPDLSDPFEQMEVERFVNQETSRLRSIGWSLKAAREAVKDAAG